MLSYELCCCLEIIWALESEEFDSRLGPLDKTSESATRGNLKNASYAASSESLHAEIPANWARDLANDSSNQLLAIAHNRAISVRDKRNLWV
jgi:hypothetical protein